MQTYSSRPGNPALKQGLLFGVITAVVEIALSFLNGFVGLGLLGSIIGLAIYLIFGLIAGQRSSVVTGKVGTGVLAGFRTGLIGSFKRCFLSFFISPILTPFASKLRTQQISKACISNTRTRSFFSASCLDWLSVLYWPPCLVSLVAQLVATAGEAGRSSQRLNIRNPTSRLLHRNLVTVSLSIRLLLLQPLTASHHMWWKPHRSRSVLLSSNRVVPTIGCESGVKARATARVAPTIIGIVGATLAVALELIQYLSRVSRFQRLEDRIDAPFAQVLPALIPVLAPVVLA